MTRYLDFKTIGEVTEKIIDYRGKTPFKTDRGIKLITAKVIKDGHIVDGKHEYISEEVYSAWMTRGFPQKWDVLITTEAPLGEVALLRTDEKIALAQRVILLRGKSNIIDQIYYMYALKTSFVQEQLRSRSVSTTVAGIKQSDLIEVKIPLLPIEEQKRIAAIARKCDRLRRTRRYTRQLSDSYLRSVFLKMFGDPVTNSMGWEILKMEEVCIKITDGTHQPPLFTLNGIPFIFVQNIVGGEINFDSNRFVSGETYRELTRSTKIEKGDILYSSVGSFGVAVQVTTDRRFVFQRHIAHLKPDFRKINSTFLCNQMRTDFIYSQAKAAARGVAQPTVNLSEIREFKIIVPPLSLQEKFAQIVQRFERLRTQQREADRQAEHLFQTILHRAFRGEL